MTLTLVVLYLIGPAAHLEDYLHVVGGAPAPDTTVQVIFWRGRWNKNKENQLQISKQTLALNNIFCEQHL